MATYSIWRIIFTTYSVFLSWQLFTPVMIIKAGGFDKLYHFAGFFCLAILARLAWRATRLTTLAQMLITYALLTEIIQYYIPGRSFSIHDWLADGVGIALALSINMAVFYSRKSVNKVSSHD